MMGNTLVTTNDNKDANITYTLDDVASMFGLKTSTIIKWVESGKLTVSHGNYVFSEEDIAKYKENFNSLDDIISTGEVCKILGVTSVTVYTYVEKGILSVAGVYPSGRRFFSRKEVEELNKSLGVSLQECDELLSRIDIIQTYGKSFYAKVNEARISGEISAARELPASKRTGARFYRKSDIEKLIEKHNSPGKN